MAYANTYKLPITIVNTMNLIGERQHPEKFVPKVIRYIMTGETIPIHADPTCTRSGTRFYLHCRTFANALAFLINLTHITAFEGGVVRRVRGEDGRMDLEYSAAPMPLKLHVCGEREIANLELAELIAELVGKPLHYQLVDFHSSRPGHDLRYAMQDSLIRELGWQRPMHLEQSLEKTVAWYLAHPRWLGLN